VALAGIGQMLVHPLPSRSHLVSDVIFISALIAFFVICALYVQLCDRMIGPDDPAMLGATTDSVVDSGAATMVATAAETASEVSA
jgi:hypothetical protein